MGAYLALEPSLPARRLDVYRAGAGMGYGAKFTMADLKDRMGWEYNRLSGRITELTKSGHFRDTGEQRNGMTLYEIGNGTPLAGSTERADSAPESSVGLVDGIDAHHIELALNDTLILRIRVKVQDMRGWMEKGKGVTIRRRR